MGFLIIKLPESQFSHSIIGIMTILPFCQGVDQYKINEIKNVEIVSNDLIQYHNTDWNR